jgi:hypothetical protein
MIKSYLTDLVIYLPYSYREFELSSTYRNVHIALCHENILYMHLRDCLRACLAAHQTTQSTWVAQTMWIGVDWCAAKQGLVWMYMYQPQSMCFGVVWNGI